MLSQVIARPDSGMSRDCAEVAELADAHGSGPCIRKDVGVRVPSSAPTRFGSLPGGGVCFYSYRFVTALVSKAQFASVESLGEATPGFIAVVTSGHVSGDAKFVPLTPNARSRSSGRKIS